MQFDLRCRFPYGSAVFVPFGALKQDGGVAFTGSRRLVPFIICSLV